MSRALLAGAAMLASISCNAGRHSNVIAAIPREISEATDVVEHAGLATAAAQNGATIYWNGPANSFESEQQIVLMDRAIERRDMGIVLTPNAPLALDTVVFRALSRKVPVVILGAPLALPPDPNLSFVLTDFRRSGELAAARIREQIGETGVIAVTGINPMLPGSAELAQAFRTSLQRIAPHIRIVSELSGAFTFGQAETATQDVLQKHPQLNAIFALSIPATRGAVAALKNTGRTGQVRLIGSDYTLDLLFLLRQGDVDALLVHDMRALGRQAVENIVHARAGQPFPVSVDKQPKLVTRNNVDDEATQQMLMMDWRTTP